MIQIDKPDEVPEILQNRGKNERRSLSAKFTKNEESFRNGERTFDFKRSIYADDDVKEALQELHHGKCCYCEAPVEPVDWLDVEHWRPKARVRQASDTSFERPGYYWLAYEWSNLLLSCSKCNTKKDELFPLANPDERARSHQDDLDEEEPLLVHPAEDEPSEHIGYRGEYPYAIDGDAKGETTIRILELNDRSELIEERRELLEKLQSLHQICMKCEEILSRDPQEDIDEIESECRRAQRILTKARQESFKFSAMVRAALDNDFEHFDVGDIEFETL